MNETIPSLWVTYYGAIVNNWQGYVCVLRTPVSDLVVKYMYKAALTGMNPNDLNTLTSCD